MKSEPKTQLLRPVLITINENKLPGHPNGQKVIDQAVVLPAKGYR